MGNIEFSSKETKLVTKLSDIVLYNRIASIESKEEFEAIKKAVSQVLSKIEINITEFMKST